MNAIAKHMLYYVLLAAVGLCVYLALSGHAQAAETAVTASQGLEGALVDIIQQVSGGVKQGVDFLQAEIPDVVRQLLVWKLVSALVYAVFGIGVIAVSVALMFKALKKPQPIKPDAHSRYGNYPLSLCYDEDGDTHPGILFIPLVLTGFIIFGLGYASNVMTAVQIYIAPKVWLIEYAASLVK